MKLTPEEVGTIMNMAKDGLGVDDILPVIEKRYRRQYYRPRIKMIVWPLSYVADARHRQRMEAWREHQRAKAAHRLQMQRVIVDLRLDFFAQHLGHQSIARNG